MISLIRKIRRNLLAENKLSKYLLYALGEIALVVVGILIAFAINNSQQNKALRVKEQTYLKGLKAEFETSKAKLSELITVNKRNYEGAKRILEFTADPGERPTERQFSELLYRSFSFDISFNSNNSLLTEMISSGSMKDITNIQLRKLLTTWIATLEDIAQQEKELGYQRKKVLDMFTNDTNSIRTIFEQTSPIPNITLSKKATSVSNLNLLNSLEFENKILMFYLTSYATETTHYSPLMEDLNAILYQLEIEID